MEQYDLISPPLSSLFLPPCVYSPVHLLMITPNLNPNPTITQAIKSIEVSLLGYRATRRLIQRAKQKTTSQSHFSVKDTLRREYIAFKIYYRVYVILVVRFLEIVQKAQIHHLTHGRHITSTGAVGWVIGGPS